MLNPHSDPVVRATSVMSPVVSRFMLHGWRPTMIWPLWRIWNDTSTEPPVVHAPLHCPDRLTVGLPEIARSEPVAHAQSRMFCDPLVGEFEPPAPLAAMVIWPV